MNTIVTDQIKSLIDYLNMTPSQFADKIQVNRSRLSHILTGRNNPSLEIVQSILNAFPEVNITWLITGEGSLLQAESALNLPKPDAEGTGFIEQEPLLDLFNYKITEKYVPSGDKRKGNRNDIPVGTAGAETTIQSTDNSGLHRKGVKRVVIYYTDRTYESYTVSPED